MGQASTSTGQHSKLWISPQNQWTANLFCSSSQAKTLCRVHISSKPSTVHSAAAVYTELTHWPRRTRYLVLRQCRLVATYELTGKLFLHGFCLVAQMSMRTCTTFPLTRVSSDRVS